MEFSNIDFIYTLPIWSIALGSLLLLIAKGVSPKKPMRPLWACMISFLSFSFSILALQFLGYNEQLLFSELFRLDQSSWLSSQLILIISIFILFLFLGKYKYLVDEKYFSEFIFLFMNSVLGMCLITWSNSLISAFVAIEYISLCFYVMIPLSSNQETSIESSLKYFVLGSVGAALFLLGIALTYISAHSLDFGTLLNNSQFLIHNNRLFILGLGLICTALLFKVAIFPFQFWLPDVYQGSSTALVAFMSTAVKAATFILLLRLVFFGGFITHSGQSLFYLFQWLAIISLILGNSLALFQDNLKRLLIYSSIGHASYMLMALLNPNVFSISSLFYYLITYAIVNIGALACTMMIEGDQIEGYSMNRLKGMFYKKPIFSLVFSWFLINLAGLPPSAGFFSKLFIFESLVQKQLWWMLFWGVVGSIIGLAYYLRPLALIFLKNEDNDSGSPSFENLPWVCACVVALFLCSLGLTVGAGWVYQLLAELWIA